MLFKSPGKIVFDPLPISGNKEKMFKDWWSIVTIEGDVDNYYRWFLQKRYGLKLQRPAWGSHISFIRGEEVSKEIWDTFKSKLSGTEIEFEYESEPKSNGIHWWLTVHCDRLKDIREEMGLPRSGKWGLHLTLGLPILLHKEHSNYIWSLYNDLGWE
jgi:hypothetical protein